MSRIHPQRLDPVPSNRPVAVDVLVREQPDDEEDEDNGKDDDDDDEKDDEDGYSE